MAPLLLLPLLLLPQLASSGSTLAVSGAYPPTVCGVEQAKGTVLCAPLLGATTAPSPVAPFLRFAEVSAGRDFACGLEAGGAALFCWPTAAPSQLRRVYKGPAALADLTVGAGHVAAYDPAARRVIWWRGGGRFPPAAAGAFRSLVAGDGFSCALEANASSAGRVRCWGPRGSEVQAAFSGPGPYSYLAAGGTRACAVDGSSGAVRCSGSGLVAAVPPGLYPYGLAVGESHACGLLRPNHTAVCWTLGGGPSPTVYYPAFGTPFEFLVAGGKFTCGVLFADYTVQCWGAGDLEAAPVPLSGILPGVCVPDQSTCDCGFVPQSAQFCVASGGGVVCKRLCDSPAASPSPPAVSPPPASPPSSSGSKGERVSKRWIAFVVVGAVGSFAGLCSIVYCLVFGFCSNKRVHNSVQPNITAATTTATDNNNNNNGGSPNASRGGLFRRQLSRAMTRQRSGPSLFKDPAEEFTLAQLEAATGGFAPETKIGEGSFGAVYRGKLPDGGGFAPETKIGEGSFGAVYRGKLPDGREVAIKRGGDSRAAPRFQEKESAFRSELAFLSRLHHKHLVGLVGYCEEDQERMLVYEYMKNGALYDHLHPKPSSPPAAGSSSVVSSWKLRIKILLDSSRGVEYLHSYAVPPIIHRDIKSSNILLDASWTARVSDFGLSLITGPGSDSDEAQPHRSQPLSAAKAAGTVGYMDPEYYGLHHLTTKSDVYGFGVVMLESLTGRRAIFRDAGEGGAPVSVVDYAVPAVVAGELAKVLDPRAPEPVAPHEAEAVELVAYTAVHCVRLEGKDRPAMADVVANLETAFALCEGSADRGGGFGNSSSSASLSVTSMDRSGALV